MSDANRIGIGYDVHRLIEGRRLILGGIEIPFEMGLHGHSDADVLTHAICDAMLGAAGLGDIGHHFPDTDPSFAGVSSIDFLANVSELVAESGFTVENVDSVIVTERPKLAPHIDAIRGNLAEALGLETARINVKAKTNEGLDSVGRGEAIAAHAVVLLAAKH